MNGEERRQKHIALLPGDADIKIRTTLPMPFQQIPIMMPGGKLLKPEVVDAIETSPVGSGHWHPNSVRTRRLLA